jgi:hypothetical protein
MTEQPGSSGPDDLVGPLQPLQFELERDDGRAAVYQAVVKDETAPRSPVYALRVTVASSIRKDSGPQLETFLGGMMAAFALLPEPVPEDDGPDDGEPFDIRTQIQFAPALVSLDGAGPVGVAMAVQTMTGIGQAPSGSDPAGGTAPEGLRLYKVPPNQDHYWYTPHKQRFTATVKPRSGYGTIGNPVSNVAAGGTYHLTSAVVIVHGNPPAGMTYLFGGTFNGPY